MIPSEERIVGINRRTHAASQRRFRLTKRSRQHLEGGVTNNEQIDVTIFDLPISRRRAEDESQLYAVRNGTQILAEHIFQAKTAAGLAGGSKLLKTPQGTGTGIFEAHEYSLSTFNHLRVPRESLVRHGRRQCLGGDSLQFREGRSVEPSLEGCRRHTAFQALL